MVNVINSFVNHFAIDFCSQSDFLIVQADALTISLLSASK